MSRKIDIPPGTVFGRLTVVRENGRSPRGDALWLCRCSCGGEVTVRGFALRRGDVTTCGACPPDNNFYFENGAAIGTLPNGVEFLIDMTDYPAVSRYPWHADGNGYVVCCNKGKTIKLHRMITAAGKGTDVDHINRNPLDNRRVNLRICSHQQNMWNMKKPKTNSTGYKGVWTRSNYNGYVAGIRINGVNTHLGCFSDKISAARAYDMAAIATRGEYARTNFPKEAYRHA